MQMSSDADPEPAEDEVDEGEDEMGDEEEEEEQEEQDVEEEEEEEEEIEIDLPEVRLAFSVVLFHDGLQLSPGTRTRVISTHSARIHSPYTAENKDKIARFYTFRKCRDH